MANSTKKTKKKVSSPRSKKELQNFQLGEVTNEYPSTYSPNLLEAFENKNPGQDAWTTFVCTEFTSLCPKTNQPDFARIFINASTHRGINVSMRRHVTRWTKSAHGGVDASTYQQINRSTHRRIYWSTCRHIDSC